MINEVLLIGAENARTGKSIREQLKLSVRDFIAAVERERRDGVPICASTAAPHYGYFLAANKDEMRRYCESMLRRAGNLHKTRRACLKTIKTLPDAPEGLDS